MSPCSFLSTAENDIECFCECAFYNWEESEGACPFKSLTGNRLGKIRDLLKLDFFQEEIEDEDEDNTVIKEIDEYYIEKEYV